MNTPHFRDICKAKNQLDELKSAPVKCRTRWVQQVKRLVRSPAYVKASKEERLKQLYNLANA